jgi:hypothetical protein
MGYEFFACDWVIQYELLDIDRIFDAAIQYNCHLYNLDTWADEDRFAFNKYGIAVLSQEHLQKFCEQIGCDSSTWYPITMQQFLRGTEIKLTDESRRMSQLALEIMLDKFRDESEFSRRLKTEWKDWSIFRTEWMVSPHFPIPQPEARQVTQMWEKMYHTAIRMNTLPGFVAVGDQTRIHRLFLPLPSKAHLEVYIEQAAPHLPLSGWL